MNNKYGDTARLSAVREELSCSDPSCECKRKGGNLHCPSHNDHNPSLSANESEEGRLLVYCHARCSQENVIQSLKDKGLWYEVKPRARSFLVRNEENVHLASLKRIDYPNGEKKVWWERPDGQKELGPLKTPQLPLYMVQFLPTMEDEELIVLTEGPKAAEAFNRRCRFQGALALGTLTGASTIPCDASLRPLLGKKVVLWPDNDEPGQKHMEAIATRLVAMGAKVWTCKWKDATNEGADAADFEGSKEELLDLIREQVEPWNPPEEVPLADILDELQYLLRRFVVMNQEEADALALWVCHTYAFDVTNTTPYIRITASEKRAGKSRLLEVLSTVVARPWLTDRTTPAALVRKIDKDSPTLLLDETDASMNGRDEYSQTLRGILNAGHRRGGVTSLNVKEHGDWVPRDFTVFSPKAFAGIGSLPDTVADRSITISLRRKTPTEVVERFRLQGVLEEHRSLRDALERWAPTALDALRMAEPGVPSELDDRAADGWEPLLAIADLAGSDWPDLGRRAAIALSSVRDEEEESLGTRLLQDCRNILGSRGKERLATVSILRALKKHSRWRRLGQEFNASTLATMLRPYDIRPKNLRMDGKIVKGYARSDFENAWERFLEHEDDEGRAEEEEDDEDDEDDLAGYL